MGQWSNGVVERWSIGVMMGWEDQHSSTPKLHHCIPQKILNFGRSWMSTIPARRFFSSTMIRSSMLCFS